MGDAEAIGVSLLGTHARKRRRRQAHHPRFSPFTVPLRFHCHSLLYFAPLPLHLGPDSRPVSTEAHRPALGLFAVWGGSRRRFTPWVYLPVRRLPHPARREARQTIASGAEEEERVEREAREEDDDEDERPQLSAAAAGALREFLEEQRRDRRDEGEKEGGVELVAEDWRLSQFWYDERTARELAEEVARLASDGAAVACVACPTLYAYLRKSSPDVPARLLEYDERFGQYGDDFTFYDYNRPEALPPAMKHAYRIVVADPPYLSQECLEKVAKTVSFLAPPEGSFLLLLTGEVQKDRALELLNVRPCGFKPQHSNKLGNVFRLFTNYDPVDRLGGCLVGLFSAAAAASGFRLRSQKLLFRSFRLQL